MTYHYKKTGFASAVALAVAAAGITAGTVAGASTMGPQVEIVGGSPDNLTTGEDNDSIAGLAALGEPIPAFTGSSIELDRKAKLTFTFHGFEAGFNNQFYFNDTLLFSNSDVGGNEAWSDAGFATQTFNNIAPGALNFEFRANGDDGNAVANGDDNNDFPRFYASFLDADTNVRTGNNLWLFFDDSGAANDDNADDMVISVQVQAVPLPAAGWLLLAGFGGLAALRRRKQAA